MAKLFRKVRQKLLAENKFRNYLLYAIGEIILVVIGILIALQINAANQRYQRSKLETILLKQVKFEILETYEDIWRDAGFLYLGERSHRRINQHFSAGKPYVDSLCFDFYWINRDEYIYPTNAAYSRIKMQGLDIIKNDSVRIWLQSLYEGLFPRLSKIGASSPDISKAFNNYYLDSFMPNDNLNLEFYHELPNDTVGSRIYSGVDYGFPRIDRRYGDELTIGYVPLDFEGLRKDPKFQMLLVQTKGYRDSKLLQYSNVRSVIKRVIELIDEELD